MLISALLLPMTLAASVVAIALIQNESFLLLLPEAAFLESTSRVVVSFWIAWIAVGVPVWLLPVKKRLDMVKQVGLVFLCLFAGGLPSFVLLNRVYPVFSDKLLSALVLVMLFAGLTVCLRQSLPRWYVPLLGVTLVAGPFLNWTWYELSLNRSGTAVEMSALLILSPFYSAHLYEGWRYGYGVACAVLVLGAACCFILGPSPETESGCPVRQPDKDKV